MKLALDIGNTNLSAALFDNQDICETRIISHQQNHMKELDPLIKRADQILAATVAPSILKEIISVLPEQACTPLVINAEDVPVRTKTIDRSATGVDRLLNALCVVREHACPAVIIDCGSAVTVDVVDPDGCFYGGAIFPGTRVMASALSRETEKLPEAELRPGPMPGRNTAEAISCGILCGSAGMIDRLVREAEEFIKKPGSIILTGGGADTMMPLLKTADLHLDRHLTLKGIIHAAG